MSESKRTVCNFKLKERLDTSHSVLLGAVSLLPDPSECIDEYDEAFINEIMRDIMHLCVKIRKKRQG